MQLAFWQKLCQKELQGTGSLITPERKVPQRLDASQNDHKSKGYPSKTSEAAFTMQKAEKADLVMQLAFWKKLCQKELQATGSLFTIIH